MGETSAKAPENARALPLLMRRAGLSSGERSVGVCTQCEPSADAGSRDCGLLWVTGMQPGSVRDVSCLTALATDGTQCGRGQVCATVLDRRLVITERAKKPVDVVFHRWAKGRRGCVE